MQNTRNDTLTVETFAGKHAGEEREREKELASLENDPNARH